MSGCLNLAFIQGIGGPELILILLVILLFFGGKRLPELAKGLGKSLREFKKATADVQDEFKEAMDAADPNKPLPGTKTSDEVRTAQEARKISAKESAGQSE